MGGSKRAESQEQFADRLTIIKSLHLGEILKHLDKDALFNVRWDLKNAGTRERFGFDAEKSFEKIVRTVSDKNLADMRCSFAYFKFGKRGNKVDLIDVNGEKREELVFPTKKSQKDPEIGFFFRNKFGKDNGCLFAVTAGDSFSGELKNLLNDDMYLEYFLLNGFACELTEACAKYVSRRVESECRVPKSRRYGLGYRGCPDLLQQYKILKLLEAEKIGIKLTEGYQLVPEFSTCGFIVFD
ncbi:hypothetical protein JXL83_04850 [candidate division WOR-3 bacterium]|nr:hypothetical protein [candidate division WOR-3 bacterium]